jgi:hypothetical protein
MLVLVPGPGGPVEAGGGGGCGVVEVFAGLFDG